MYDYVRLSYSSVTASPFKGKYDSFPGWFYMTTASCCSFQSTGATKTRHPVFCVMFVIALNWFKIPMKVIDRTKVVTQHLMKNSFKKLEIKKEIKFFSEKHKK